MLELLSLYLSLIFISSLTAFTLNRVGVHLMVRGQILASFVLAQAALIGVSLGSVIAEKFEPVGIPHGLIELGGGILFCLLCDRLFLRGVSSSQERLEKSFAFYTLLIAANALFLALAPGLESHRAQSFFGDPATALDSELWIMAGVAVLSLGCTFLYEKNWTRNELLQALSGGLKLPTKDSAERIFAIIRPILFVSSIFCFGLLWTLAMLFLAPIFLRRCSLGQAGLLALAGTLAVVGNIAGFSLSLAGPEWPSAASIVLCLGALVILAERFLKRSSPH